MRPGRWSAALLAATLTGCASTGADQAAPRAAPTPSAQPSTAASPSSAATPAPVALPAVKDATGLPGTPLIAAPPVRVRGAAKDGTARVVVPRPGFDRTYLLGPARRAVAATRPAMVLVLPAANTNLRTEYDRYALDALRDHGMTVVVVGNQASNWNAGTCCGEPARDGVDDVAAIAAVRDDALRRSGADSKRVAVLGHSVGGLMAWRLACEPAFGAAAVVAVSGTLVHPCPTRLSRTPDLLALHGERDRTIPLEGSDRPVPLLGAVPPSVRKAAAAVARSGGCGPASSSRTDGATTTTYDRCSAGGSVRLSVVSGAGHPWEALDATRRAARFLKAVLPGVR